MDIKELIDVDYFICGKSWDEIKKEIIDAGYIDEIEHAEKYAKIKQDFVSGYYSGDLL